MVKIWVFIRSSITYLVAGLGTVGIALMVIIHSTLRPRGASIEPILKAFGKLWVTMSGMRLEVRGTENLQQSGPYIIVANHRSNIDIMTLIAALPIPIRFLSKKEVFKFPVMGAAMRGAGMVPLDREMGRRELASIIRGARVLLSEGRSLVILPERTRSVPGEMLPFKHGAFFIAAQLACPVLPVAVSGTGAIWPPQSSLIRAGPVKVSVMPPISVTRRAGRQSNNLAERIRQELTRELARM